jgi:indolepyruvate ferredoxin oxidoreductase alpha subunit
VLILDNGTTAMTGQQEHPGTGRRLGHEPTARLSFEDLARSMGISRVQVIDPVRGEADLEKRLREALTSNDLNVIITRRPCILAAGKIKQYEQAAAASTSCTVCGEPVSEGQ